MAEKKGYDEIFPFLSSLAKGFETFSKELEWYKNRGPDNNGNNLKEFLDMLQENDFIDSMIEKVPMKYRPLARAIKNWPWSYTVDFFSAMLKEYGRDESGSYKTTGEVVREFISSKIKEKIFRG